MQLSRHLMAMLTTDGDDVAVDCGGDTRSWGDLRRTGDAIDAALKRGGIERGGRVAVLARNRPAHYAAMANLLATERTIVTVNPLLGQHRLVEDLETLGVAAVIAASSDLASDAVRAVARESVGVIIELTDDIDDPVRSKLADGGRVASLEPAVAVEMLTSGTTGPPKRVPISYRTLERSLDNILQHHFGSRVLELRHRRSVTILTAPPVHMSGFYASLRTLVEGRVAVQLERFETGAWIDAIRRHRPVAASLVPAAIRMILDSDAERADLESLRILTSGAAPLPVEVAQAFYERFGIPILASYGATEFAGAVVGWNLDDHERWGASKVGSVGRPHPGTEVRVVDADGADVTPGAVGLLEIRSDQVPSGGWVTTSDLASVDDDGFVWIRGRADGAINRGGYKIVPADVAGALERHPAVREAAVIGAPDERLGQVPVAFVELKSDIEHVDGTSLREFVRGHLTPYETPVQVHVLSALPRTASMKVCEADLRALLDDSPDVPEGRR